MCMLRSARIHAVNIDLSIHAGQCTQCTLRDIKAKWQSGDTSAEAQSYPLQQRASPCWSMWNMLLVHHTRICDSSNTNNIPHFKSPIAHLNATNGADNSQRNTNKKPCMAGQWQGTVLWWSTWLHSQSSKSLALATISACLWQDVIGYKFTNLGSQLQTLSCELNQTQYNFFHHHVILMFAAWKHLRHEQTWASLPWNHPRSMNWKSWI